MKILILTLLIPISSLADITEEEMQTQMKAAAEAAALADSELPPCEGHDQFDDIVRRFAPPSSCPKARKYFDYHLQISQKIRDNCRVVARWMEDLLREPGFCSSDAGRQAVHKKLSAFKSEISSEEEMDKEERILENENDLNFYLEDTSAPRPKKGEWARMECVQGVRIAMQFRVRQRGLANRHFGNADEAISSVCEEGPKAAGEYLDFLRYGEDGL